MRGSGRKNADPPSTAEPSVKDRAGASGPNFPVVGIGASAGGLKAFEAFLSGMPGDPRTGIAFVFVQHLSPDHKSLLADLIKRYTRMEVFEVEDGMAVRPDCAYIIPPNRDMALLNGHLQLLEPASPRGQRLPIDFFFRSLAQDQGDRAIGVVLSGTGSDGTQGIRAIKGEGGMVMAQTPESTEYDGMPRSAIATGLVDFVMEAAAMPRQIVSYVSHPLGTRSAAVSPPTSDAGNAMKKVFVLLRNQTGHDFSQYKAKTVSRRIERRMAVHQVDDLGAYVAHLQQDPKEVDALFHDLLIGVTRFFRDPEAFTALQEEAIPALFARKPSDGTIRVWVPGCSTGEEAYSVAIALQEQMEARKHHLKVQMFATDIDARAIAHARAGLYPAGIAADVSPERLSRFFSPEPDGSAYRVRKAVRNLLVFSEQDLVRDPPFSRLDLISCRNVLIYMGGELQKKLIPLFHYALNPDGLLFLGSSESVGDRPDLFVPLDRKAKLYRKKEDVRESLRAVLGRVSPPGEEARSVRYPVHPGTVDRKILPREATERALLQQHVPVAVLVGEDGEILYLHGRTGRFLEPAPGNSGMNVLRMACEGLGIPLRSALKKASSSNGPVRYMGLPIVTTGGGHATVHLTVRPVEVEPGGSSGRNLFLVVIEEAAGDEAERYGAPAGTGAGLDEADPRIAALKNEIRAKEEHLRAANEELETSNEELQSANEELQSGFEELQSTNEELETSKEELQSVNEELATVNAELQAKVADLTRVNNDMNNLLSGTGLGTVFVDLKLRILRFTPAVTQLINLIPGDVGRPVGHILSNLSGYDTLVRDVEKVLDTLVPIEVEVQTLSGAWFLLRIRPYRTLENVIEGAVLTFTEITEVKKALALARETDALRRLTAVARDSRDAILSQDMEGRILAWNPAAERMYGYTEAEALAMNVRRLIPPGRQAEAASILWRLASAKGMEPIRLQRIAKGGRIVEVWATATALVGDDGETYAVAMTERPAE
jgi:two-component system CheB/CheR fusion protein